MFYGVDVLPNRRRRGAAPAPAPLGVWALSDSQTHAQYRVSVQRGNDDLSFEPPPPPPLATAGTPGLVCTAGSYCPVGSTSPTPCPQYTTSAAGAWAATDCAAVAGYYAAPPGDTLRHRVALQAGGTAAGGSVQVL